jgi:serine protease Do
MKRTCLALACVALGALLSYLGQSVLQGRPSDAPGIPKELTSYRDIVKRVLPAVVSLDARGRAAARSRRPGDMALPADEADEAPLPRVGFGSGFLVSPKGVVVTNGHVLEGAEQVQVQLRSGKKFLSRTFYTDPKNDLAVVLLDGADGLPVLEFGDSDAMEIGDRVLAFGAPFGLTGTVTQGIVSSKGRSMRKDLYEDFFQTDAAINPGSSGGPLVNLEGKVIAITSAIKSRTGGFQGIGLAISSNLARWVVKQLVKDGVVRRGYLGVGMLDVNDEIAKELGLAEVSGVKVTRLHPDAPGMKAGLKPGDVIVRIAGKPVRDGRDLQMIVTSLPVGKAVEVEFVRGGRKQVLEVTIEEQPGK